MTGLLFSIPGWLVFALFLWWFGRGVARGESVLAGFADFSMRTLTFVVALAISWQVFCLIGAPVYLSSVPAAAAAIWLLGGSVRISGDGREPADPRENTRQALILAAALVLINLPVFWYVAYNGFADTPDLYLYVDQPWHISHTLALKDDCVPKDLSFSGKVMRYHYGYTLVAAMLGKMFYAEAGPAFNVIANAMARMWIAGGFILALLRPGGTGFRQNHAALILALGAFILYFDFDFGLALYWLLFSRDFSLLPGYEPYFQPQVFMLNGLVGPELFVFSLMIPFTGLLMARRYFLAAPLLGYASFVRPQGFLSFALAYVAFAGWRLVRDRDIKPAAAGFAALAVMILLQTFGMLRLEDFGVTIGKGYGFEYFSKSSVIVSWAWSVAGLGEKGLAGAAEVILSNIIRLMTFFVFAAPVIYLARRAGAGGPRALTDALAPWGYAAISAFLLYFLPFIIVFKAGDELNRLYMEILNIPYDKSYTRAGFAIHSLRTGEVFLTFLGAALLFETYAKYGPRLKKLAASCAAVTAVMFALGYARPPSYYSEAVNVRDTKEVLKHAPAGAVIFTNQNAHPAENNSRKYRNVLYPALFGNQFYASNFVYNNLHTEDDRKRLEEIKWFWGKSFDEENVAYLKRHGIGYLFINDNFPNNIPEEIERFGLRETASGGGYRLIRVE